MRKGVEYRDVAKEIVKILTKYEATVKDVGYILGWLDDEMMVRPVQESKTIATNLDMDYIYKEVMSRFYEEVHQGLVRNAVSTEQSSQQ